MRALVDPEGGMRSVRALDNVSFTDWFKSHGGSEGSIRRMWDPIAYALGFLNCDQVCCGCSLLCSAGLWPFFGPLLGLLVGVPIRHLCFQAVQIIACIASSDVPSRLLSSQAVQSVACTVSAAVVCEPALLL